MLHSDLWKISLVPPRPPQKYVPASVGVSLQKILDASEKKKLKDQYL